jgi:hypothetical protein
MGLQKSVSRGPSEQTENGLPDKRQAGKLCSETTSPKPAVLLKVGHQLLPAY